jgi:GH25 family lysozyme M1 (1,4-beta-N-acetylmuramidase)
MMRKARKNRRGIRVAAAVALTAAAGSVCAVMAGDASAAVTPAAAVSRPAGVDVSIFQRGRTWPQGLQFAYIKATEGLSYRNPAFAEQYNFSYRTGLMRGAYHYARPDRSNGDAQADYFVAHGGGWSRDGHTLPGAIDLENTKNVDYCYGKRGAPMRTWIHDFVNRYHARTGRWAVIYTRANWWNYCTGNDGSFAADSPLWLANFNSIPGAMPSGWRTYSFWQYSDAGGFDRDTWNGSPERLKALACDGAC